MTPTRNPLIKLYDTGNLYSITDPADLMGTIYRAVIHFQRKHGRRPTAVLVNHDLLAKCEGELRIEGEDGTTYTAHILADGAQQMTSFTVIAEGKDGN